MGRFKSTPVDNEYGHFDSKTEFDYYIVLLNQEKNGFICNLRKQVPFILMESFKLDGKTIRKMEYIADYVYEKEGKIVICDVKGSKYLIEETFKIKFKLLKNLHRDYKYEIILRENGKWYNIENKEENKSYMKNKKEKKLISEKKKIEREKKKANKLKK